jgi:RNA polymerase sigma-70 factor (ECF subfamily)
MAQQELIPHLFRTEAGKITAVLCKTFTLAHLEVAEDITSETFLAALETWPYRGIPENPVAWLYTVARNKARNRLHREKLFAQQILGDTPNNDSVGHDIDLTDANIFDSQLQMLFALCHPTLPAESQIGLSLRILCGFGIDEIANAFLTTKEVINKRLFRAKQKLREQKIALSFPSENEMTRRLPSVMTTLYLLFNEGYYSESQNPVLREDLCAEAMRLVHLLLQRRETNCAEVNALMALMYFHASRFEARKNETGEIVLYQDQDEAKWNKAFISRGAYYLHSASHGEVVSKYHLEAGIAYWHTIKEDTLEKWENILQLYNRLLQIEYSPVAALNRTYAVAKVKGNAAGIEEAEKLQLVDNHYYFALLGELYRGSNIENSRNNFERSLQLAKTISEKQIILKKLEALRK